MFGRKRKIKEKAENLHIYEIDRDGVWKLLDSAFKDMQDATDISFMYPYILGAIDMAFLLRVISEEEKEAYLHQAHIKLQKLNGSK